jgi:RNA polymerase sigma-70 factor (ECF subfamily)
MQIENARPSLQPQKSDAEQIAMLRDEMVRFATLQLRDAILAEDVVHEAINAALSSDKYSGRGSLKSWVYAILRNKIIDVIRERSRHPGESFVEEQGEHEDPFDERDHWKQSQTPTDWGRPDKVLANEQFWVIFELCLNRLPENTARVFMMREHLGLELKEVCRELEISDKNAWVIMHRARMQLRQCLEMNFITGAQL